jgi:DNA repair protein RecN (Recombination protein N)
MLLSLYISNYALISELNISFEDGFTVLTGETGAGKSIILGALSLIMGQRADSKSIKQGSEKCIIEAKFDLTKCQHLIDFFNINELDYDATSCLIRRELTISGKSRSFINDTPVSLNLIKLLSSELLDIHSQHENLLISNNLFQIEVVDIVASNSKILKSYQLAYKNYKSLLNQLSKLQELAIKQSSDLDYIQFQFFQLDEAQLVDGEQEDLEIELNALSHAEEIKINLLKTLDLLNSDNASLSNIKESQYTIDSVKSYINRGNEWSERLQSAYIELKDIVSEINLEQQRVECDPARLEWVENRLNLILTLQKRYKLTTVLELIQQRNEFKSNLERIEKFDDEISNLKLLIDESFSELESQSKFLTDSRVKAVATIESFLVTQLTKLGMPNIQFEVVISELQDFTEMGKDEVIFYFSANKNSLPQPVAQIASGGEVSRLMLALKSMIANKSQLSTVIFDEIDTGVSGEIAHKMGEIMRNMSDKIQIITITHLPQIAAKGSSHFKVYKADVGGTTETKIQSLNIDDRVNELAQMLSGKNITDGALQHAKELLKN